MEKFLLFHFALKNIIVNSDPKSIMMTKYEYVL